MCLRSQSPSAGPINSSPLATRPSTPRACSFEDRGFSTRNSSPPRSRSATACRYKPSPMPSCSLDTPPLDCVIILSKIFSSIYFILALKEESFTLRIQRFRIFKIQLINFKIMRHLIFKN